MAAQAFITVRANSEEPAEQSERSFCLVQSYLIGIYLKCLLYSTTLMSCADICILTFGFK